MNTLKVILTITILTLFGGFLRFYGLVDNPPGLNIDEVAYGYSAYSILKTGRDENGEFMPLFFRSVGDFKNPVLIYSLVPSILIFGLNEFGVRFTTALAGTFSIPIFFLFINLLLKNIKVSLIGATLLTISPWHIYYSRFASDHLMGLFILMLGVLFLVKMQNGSRAWTVLAGVTLSLSMYTYHPQRLFVPLFLLIYFGKKIKENATFFLIFFILIIPILFFTFFGQANTRAGMVFLSQDIDYTRYVIIDHIQRGGEQFSLFFFWIKRYLNYFQPDFLFFNGLDMTKPGTIGLGVLHLFELPLLILGLGSLIKGKIPKKKLIIAWILLGIIPASLANNEQSAGRSLIILPALLVVTSAGALSFFILISKIKNLFLKYGITGSCFFLTIIGLINAFLVFSVHFPKQRGEAFMEGTKESVLYALANKDNYREVVYDPYRGIEAPYIVNIPYMYILFYSKYDPAVYQTEKKIYGMDYFHFDKFTIRKIDWRKDKDNKDILFIGSPWSLPEKDIKNEEILKRIYLSGGNLALLIVSPF